MLMDTNRTPLALGPADGEALWCAGALTTVKAAAEQTAGAYSMIEDLAPQGGVRRSTATGRTTRRSTSSTGR
jgi:hypothetical protein